MYVAPLHFEVIVKWRTIIASGCLLATLGATATIITHQTAEYESLTLLIGILALFAGAASAASP